MDANMQLTVNSLRQIFPATRCCRHSPWLCHLVNAKAKGRHGVVCRLNCVIHVWAPWGRDTCHLRRYINPRTFTFSLSLTRFPPTFPWFIVKSLTFPWQLSNSPTFPGFPDKCHPVIIHTFGFCFTNLLFQCDGYAQHGLCHLAVFVCLSCLRIC